MWFHVLFRFVADSFWFGMGVLLLFDVAFGLVYERACTRWGCGKYATHCGRCGSYASLLQKRHTVVKMP